MWPALILQVVLWVAATAISYAMRPKSEAPKAAGIDDFKVPTAEDGREVPVLFGTRDLSGPNVVWYGDLRTVAVQKKGGKK